MRTLILSLSLLLSGISFHAFAQHELPDSIAREYDKLMKKIPAYEQMSFDMTEDQLINILDRQPSFAVYKDTYIAAGVPMNQKITRNSSDVLVQLSIRQRVTKSYLPFNTFVYITYTQKSFWGAFAPSCPFRDHNFNPGLGLGKYIIHNNRLKGAMFMQAEHESNGKDSIDSRTWNYFSFSVKYFYNPRVTLAAKAWIPWVDGSNNRDLLDYKGIATFSINYMTPNSKWWFAAEINPRKGFGNVNSTATAAFRVSKNHNQYLYARFYDGYGESLLDYNKYALNFRIGFCIKPDFFSVY